MSHPPENSLQVYCTRTAISRKLEEEYLAEMPPLIRASIVRYRRWQDRQATLLGKMLLLRVLLQEDCQTGRKKLQTLQTTRHGKPFIPAGPEFNISHSGELVVLAVSRHGQIGVDIEQIRTVDIRDFSQYVPEVADFGGRDDNEAMSLFFELWTQKEAVLKACGTGLLASPEHISIREGCAFHAGVNWFTKKIFLGDEYRAHIVTDRPPPESISVEEVESRHLGLCLPK